MISLQESFNEISTRVERIVSVLSGDADITLQETVRYRSRIMHTILSFTMRTSSTTVSTSSTTFYHMMSVYATGKANLLSQKTRYEILYLMVSSYQTVHKIEGRLVANEPSLSDPKRYVS